jgi:AraC-like DNA-binding protein
MVMMAQALPNGDAQNLGRPCDRSAKDLGMSAFQFRLNPPFAELPSCSAVLNGVAQRYQVQQYRTTLSLKSVTRGAALYATRQARHLVTEDSFLILNHGQEYSLEFQGPATTETLALFFEPGFVEHVADAVATPCARQLDEIAPRVPTTEWHERLYPNCGRIASLLHRLHQRARRRLVAQPWLEDQFYTLAAALIGLRTGVQAEVDQFPGQRPATRMELYRRLHRARDFLSASYADPVSVAMAASAAHLSPYHFQRMFKEAFHQTPMQFLQECRLAAARRLLLATDQPVTVICFAVGFESLGSFSWLFRKRFGISPRPFRAQRRGRRNPQD